MVESSLTLHADGISKAKKKIIIDADPGIDDAMAIFMALQSPELEIIGITTIFGNTSTSLATRNALHLLELAGADGIPVSEGSSELLNGEAPSIHQVANGSDGLGNTVDSEPRLRKTSCSACDFLVEKILNFAGEITILALGPLTNIAQAFRKEESLAKKVQHVIVCGGSFFSSGNVNPASEANIHGDPEAADIVFASGAPITVIGMNVTSQVVLDECGISSLSDSPTGYRKPLLDMLMFYRELHLNSDGFDGVFVHGPTCLAAVISPSLFTYKSGVVRVETCGVCRGHTLFDMGLKRWSSANPWVGRDKSSVAWSVDVKEVLRLVKQRL